MGLMLSILVVCVGVIEVLSCFEHFQYGVIHCATNVYESARRRSSVFLQYTSKRLKLLSENSISECDEPANIFEPIKFDQDSFERQPEFLEEKFNDLNSMRKPVPIRMSREDVKKLEKEEKIEIVKKLLEKPRKPKTVRSISMPELAYTEEDIELTKIINDLAIEPVEEIDIEIEEANCEVLSREFDQLFSESENSPQDSGIKGSPVDKFDEYEHEKSDDSGIIEESKFVQLECDLDNKSVNENNEIKNLNEVPVNEEFLKTILEKENAVSKVIKTNISQSVNEKGADLFKGALNRKDSLQKSKISGLGRSTSVDFSKVSSMMIIKPAAVSSFSEMSNDSLELIPDQSISHNKLEEIFESDTPPEEVIDKTFEEIYENIYDESLDVANIFEEIEKNILRDAEDEDLDNFGLHGSEMNLLNLPKGKTSFSTGKTVSNAVFLKAVEQLAELLVRDSLNLHKIRNLITENANNVSVNKKVTRNNEKFDAHLQLENRMECKIQKENVCLPQEVPDIEIAIRREENDTSQKISNDRCVRKEGTKTVLVKKYDLGDPLEEEFEKITSSLLGSEISDLSVGADVESSYVFDGKTDVKPGEVLGNLENEPVVEFPVKLETEITEDVGRGVVNFLPDSEDTKTDVDSETECKDNMRTQEGVGISGQDNTRLVADHNFLLSKDQTFLIVDIARLEKEPLSSLEENAKTVTEVPAIGIESEGKKSVVESKIEYSHQRNQNELAQQRVGTIDQKNETVIVNDEDNFLTSKEDLKELVKSIQDQKPRLVEVAEERREIPERLVNEQSILEIPKKTVDSKVEVEEAVINEISTVVSASESTKIDTKTELSHNSDQKEQPQELIIINNGQNYTKTGGGENKYFLPSQNQTIDVVKNIQQQKSETADMVKEFSQILEHVENKMTSSKITEKNSDKKIEVGKDIKTEITATTAFGSEGTKTAVVSNVGSFESNHNVQTQETIDIANQSKTVVHIAAADSDDKNNCLPNKQVVVSEVKNFQDHKQHPELMKHPTIEFPSESDNVKTETGNDIKKEELAISESQTTKTTVERITESPIKNSQNVQTQEKIEMGIQSVKTIMSESEVQALDDKNELLVKKKSSDSVDKFPGEKPALMEPEKFKENAGICTQPDTQWHGDPANTNKTTQIAKTEQEVFQSLEFKKEISSKKKMKQEEIIKPQETMDAFKFCDKIEESEQNAVNIIEIYDADESNSELTNKSEFGRAKVESQIKGDQNEQTQGIKDKNQNNQVIDKISDSEVEEKNSLFPQKKEEIGFVQELQELQDPLSVNLEKCEKNQKGEIGVPVDTTSQVDSNFTSGNTVESKQEPLLIVEVNKEGNIDDNKLEQSKKIGKSQEQSNQVVDLITNEAEVVEEEKGLPPEKEESANFYAGFQGKKPLPVNREKSKKSEKNKIGTPLQEDLTIVSENIQIVESKDELVFVLENEKGGKIEENKIEPKKKMEETRPEDWTEPLKPEEPVLKFHDEIGEYEENEHFEEVVEENTETLHPDSKSRIVNAKALGSSFPKTKDESSDLENSKECVASGATSAAPEAFWLIFSGEYTKAMSKDWHSGHFSCWQCDEALTGQRYVLRDDHPYCIKCYESVFANVCEECNKIIGIDSKDLSYKDKHWHEACFLCNKCRVSLVDKQFGSKADKIYCGNCYDAQFASRCDGCGEIFRAGTKKMEYKTRQWHEKCFCCCVCKTPIGTKSFIPREQEIYCATCYEEKFATRCVKCNKIITSGGVTYKNEPWHRECFTCTNCNTSLAGQRFTSRDEKPYCADCFGELFAKRCTACSRPITGIGGTRFISFEDRHWHNDCFICASCKTSLVGRGFITDGDDIICPECAKQKLM